MPKNYIIGILSLQGGFVEIKNMLSLLSGITIKMINNENDINNVDALIIPGGESTTIINLIKENNLEECLFEFLKTKPVYGICAGLILLTNYFFVDLSINLKKNYFGRQNKSFFNKIELKNQALNYNLATDVHFIRAPGIINTNNFIENNIEELAKINNTIVAIKKEKILGTCFHPEITSDGYTWFLYFFQEICGFENIILKNKPNMNNITPWCRACLNSNEYNNNKSVKRSFLAFQQKGVIMDVVNKEQAKLAEEAGAVSVMALERIPADIILNNEIARSSDPKMIKEIMNSVDIPVMAKVRIGHFAEAQILEHLEVDCIDESEVLTCADEVYHINKHKFKIPFVCGAKDLGEALRRISEGASMIRLKGHAGTGNVLHAVRHARSVFSEIKHLQSIDDDEIFVFAKEHKVSVELLQQVKDIGRLPVVTFAAGGIATPADVSLLMQMGCDGVFVGSGIFKGENPLERAKAMVLACSQYNDPSILTKVSTGLGKGMVGVLNKDESYNLLTNDDDKI